MGTAGSAYLALHHLSLGLNMTGFAVTTTAVGSFMVGAGINYNVPYLRAGGLGNLAYDVVHGSK